MTKPRRPTLIDLRDDPKDDDYFITCYVEDRIITLKELKELQEELSKIKGYYFEVHAAITSK
jgi:hypothetical protein